MDNLRESGDILGTDVVRHLLPVGAGDASVPRAVESTDIMHRPESLLIACGRLPRSDEYMIPMLRAGSTANFSALPCVR